LFSFQTAEFIADHFLPEQIESIKKGGNYITMLQKAGPGLGEYMFDRETLQEESS
jgi:ferritin heavy chain